MCISDAAVEQAKEEMASQGTMVDSTGDSRTVNNTMRHQYRVLSEEEKLNMTKIKDAGLVLHDILSAIGDSRELSLAKTKVEEAVMWGVKHLTK